MSGPPAWRVVVTGGAGFIGSHLVDRLVADGHTVTVIDNLSTGRLDNLSAAMASGRCEVVRADVTDRRLASVVAQARPVVVFHLAAQVNVRTSVVNPRTDAHVNAVGTAVVVQAARLAGARRVVYASSVAGFGSAGAGAVCEATPVRPLSPYAVSKYAGELYVQQAHALHGISAAVVVLTNTYGPRQESRGEAGVVTTFIRDMRAGTPTRVYGDGSNTRDYLYVTDATAALAAAGQAPAGHPRPWMRFTIGTGVATTDLALHAAVARRLGLDVRPGRVERRPGDVRHMRVDARHAGRVLGWRAQVGLDEGIARTVAGI